MKASKVIEMLTALIELHGDLETCVSTGQGSIVVESIHFVELQDKKYEDFIEIYADGN